MDVQLYVKQQTGTQYISLDLFPEQKIKLTLSVQNIQDPLASTSVFSRTFRVPHTSINGPYFKAVFNVNSTDFDASVKAPAYINDNGVFFASGNIRLSAIYVNEQTNNVEYEINFYGETSDFGSKIGGGFLSQIDLTNYNHNQTATNIINSWSGGLFAGDIIYPLIEWGYTYDNEIPTTGTFAKYNATTAQKGTFGPIASPPPTANVILQSQFKPSIRVKALWDKIFAETGYKYTSTFLNSTEFTNLYLISEDKARTELLASQLFLADNFASQTNNSGGTYDVFFTNELFDNGNQYTPGTSVFQAASAGVYNFYFEAVLTGPTIPNLRAVGAFPQLVDADTGAVLASTGTPAIITTTGLGPFATPINQYFSVSLAPNQRVRIRIQYTSLNPPDAEVPISMFNQSFTLNSAPENVSLSSVMPSNIRKIDFMRSIINRFRLVFVPSKDNANSFEITPWKDWILQGNSLDWTSKLDGSKDMKITPLFYGQDRLQVYKDQEDADFVNYNYQLAFKQTYGQLNLDSNNELIKGTKVVQDQFAPTPLFPIGNVTPTDPLYEVVMPHLAKDTNTERQPIQPKLRLVYYNGLQSVPGGNQWWLQADYGLPSARLSYPLVSQYSTWPVNTNTFDLAWENEPPLYDTDVSGLSPARTTFDCFSVYWRKWYDVTFDPFSRIVEANFILDWSDIINLKFNDYIFVKDAWYFVNKISDYVAGQNTNCKVELVKLGNNLGLNIPINIPIVYNPATLCFAASKCDAYCCFDSATESLFYINNTTLATSTFIFADEFGSIPAPTGWYSDGITIALVGPSGLITTFGVNDCDCDRESYGFEVCPGGLESGDAFCESCCCFNEPITIYGANADFGSNLYFYSDVSLTVPVPDGWYNYTGAASPTQSWYIENGEVYFINLCETSTGCDEDGCTSYSLFSSAGAGVSFTPCGSELPISVVLNPGVTTTICAETGTASVAYGTATITAQPAFIPVCDCDPGPEYTPYTFRFAETLCAVCCGGTDVTLWLEEPETPDAATILYSNALGTTTAGAGYYVYGGDVLIVDAAGNVTAYGNCESCTCDYYYVAENCQEEILQNFSHPTPLTIGTVISSSSFPGQCWTIIDVAASGFPIDFVYASCEQCLGIEVPCECLNYDITTFGEGGAIQYLDCATQEVVYTDLPPDESTQQCACADSIIALVGGMIITPIGPCAESSCTEYDIDSPEGGSISVTLCGEELPILIAIEAGAFYRICAVTGSITVDSGTVNVIEFGPC